LWNNREVTHVILALVLAAAGPAASPASQSAPAQRPRGAANAEQVRPADPRAEAYYQFMLGRRLDDEGETDGAVAAFRRALELDPASAEIYAELAALFARQGRAEEAIASAEASLKVDPDHIEANRLLGLIYADRAGADDERPAAADEAAREAARKAVDYLERALPRARFEQAVGIRMTLGRLYLQQQAAEKAIVVLRQVLVDDPGVPQAIALLARAYGTSGKTDAVIELLKDAAVRDPSFYGSLGEACEKESRWTEAAAAYEQAAKVTPGNSDLKTRWALALLNVGGADNRRRARDLLLDVTRVNSTSGWPLYLLARAQRESGDLDAAEQTARRLLALSSTSVSGAHALAQVLAQRRDFARIIDALEPIVDKLPAGRESDQALLLSHLGFAYLETGRVDASIAAFQRAQSLNPGDGSLVVYLAQALNAGKQYEKTLALIRPRRVANPSDLQLARVEADAWRGQGKVDDGAAVLIALTDPASAPVETFEALGEYYASARRYSDAAAALARARQRFPDSLDVLFQFATMLERQKLTTEAERVFRDVIARDPAHAAALNYLGYMMADRESRLPEALDLIKRAVALEPHNGAFLDSLGWAYFKLGRLDEAETHLKTAALQLPRDSAVQDHWGDLLAKLGRHAEAVRVWQRALDGDGESIDRAVIERKIKKSVATQR
jgi:tetratricopeptide (TPR) repeat protein